jgi:hypothetical protein
MVRKIADVGGRPEQRAAAVVIVEVVQRRGQVVKAAYQEVVEQLVKVFEDHLNGPRARERALALAALCGRHGTG